MSSNLTYTDDPLVAGQWSRKALELMAANNVAPVPSNYEVWFLYASERRPDLNREIEERIIARQAFDPSASDDLHSRHVSQTNLATAALETGDKLGSELDKILKLVETAAGDSSALGSAVRQASAGLDNKSSATDVGKVVEAIVAATRHMESRSKQLEQRLHETKSELNVLQTNLSKARNEARTDGLTGVANRKAFDEALAEQLERAQTEQTPLCLVMSDIDHFKKFNDTWGHRTGDQVLRLVAQSLKSGARENDIVARYGGEEFAIIMPCCTVPEAEAIANAIRQSVQARDLVKRSTGESLGKVTVSLGVSILRPGDKSASLIERADGCLYEAKRSGRNRVICDHGLDQPALRAG